MYCHVVHNGVLYCSSFGIILCGFQLDSMGLRPCVLLHWIHWVIDWPRYHAESTTNVHRSCQFRTELFYRLLHWLRYYALRSTDDSAVRFATRGHNPIYLLF
jgi:hypothetical protein